ncbi:MAG: hypothetical protein Q7R41_06725 [Phycisphaerales bacterium]|nr:hypothetical protein [Phycisphaerales bacterium]
MADYAVGECGAPESPIPKDFFTRVKMAENAVELTDDDETHRFVLTSDQFVYSEHTSSSTAEFGGSQVDDVRRRAKHLITGAMQFLKAPSQILFGIVWDYVNAPAGCRERFKHPSAEFLTRHMLKLDFDPKEYPTEINARVTFRRQLQDSVVRKGHNDYINAILTVRDEKVNTLWNKEERLAARGKTPFRAYWPLSSGEADHGA